MAIKAIISLSKIPAPERVEPTAAAHDETGAIMQTGAAVESIRYASFARAIRYLSVTGFITVPTVKQLK